MTNAEMEREVSLREADGRDHMIVTVVRKREPKGCSPRIRVLPGVSGRMVGFVDQRAVVDVLVADLRRYLDKQPASPEPDGGG